MKIRDEKGRFCSCAYTEFFNELYSKILKQDNGCWVWIGSKNHTGFYGYGAIHWKNKTYLVHRFIYEMCKGKIPNGMDLCHKCDNPPCCNPEHMFVGTRSDNMRDSYEKGRSPRGEKHYKAKLKTLDIISIREDPRKYIVIAKDYGVGARQISYIKKGKSWSWV